MSYRITGKEIHLNGKQFLPNQEILFKICETTRNQRNGIKEGIDGIKGLAPGDIPSKEIEPLVEAYYKKNINTKTRVLTPENKQGFISITIVTLLGTALLSFIIFNIISKIFIH